MYLRHHGVGGHDVLHLLGPGVHEAEPATPQSDERTVFDLELVTVGVDLLSHLQHWSRDITGNVRPSVCALVCLPVCVCVCSSNLVGDIQPSVQCRLGGNTRRRRFPGAPEGGRPGWLWLWRRRRGEDVRPAWLTRHGCKGYTV